MKNVRCCGPASNWRGFGKDWGRPVSGCLSFAASVVCVGVGGFPGWFFSSVRCD